MSLADVSVNEAIERKLKGRTTAKRPMRTVLVLLAIGTNSGCEGVDYLLSLAAGQAGVLINAVPIEKALRDDTRSDEERNKLELVVAARQFAVDVMGLEANGSFTTFLDTSGQPAGYNVSASAKHSFSPVTWTFPFVGTVPYLGFFDRRRAEAMQQSLADADYDTVLFEVDAFSTLGVFPDPVRSTMLRRDEISLADTVIHELAHNSIWRVGDVRFNESLATFVGRSGALQLLADRYGEDAPILDEVRQRFEDTNRYNTFIANLHDELAAFYDGPATDEEKAADRELIFEAARRRFAEDVLPAFNDPDAYAAFKDLPTNNALILANLRYNTDLDLFEQVFAANDGHWPATLAVFAQAAIEDEPTEYMRRWLTEQGP